MQSIDLIWTLVSFVLTLMIFSYLLGDNPLFRVASYIFVGVTAGYSAVLVIYQVILPRLFQPLIEGAWEERVLTLIPLVLSVLLLTKISPKLSQLGSVSMGYLVGVGAAVAISGAVMGTLINQVVATVNVFDLRASAITENPAFQLLNGFVMVLGIITTLSYFQFTGKAKQGDSVDRSAVVEALAKFGQVFIAITLGALFAGVFSAAVVALIDRLDFLLNVIRTFILS